MPLGSGSIDVAPDAERAHSQHEPDLQSAICETLEIEQFIDNVGTLTYRCQTRIGSCVTAYSDIVHKRRERVVHRLRMPYYHRPVLREDILL